MAMPITEAWTIEQLDRLPDDGNRYELVDGELFVTPAPSDVHEWLLSWLRNTLVEFVRTNDLGWVQSRGVIRRPDAHLEPDILVRPTAPLRGWERAPRPSLVVEVLSTSTRDRDLGKKREYYVRSGIPEYWIVDREAEIVIQIRGADEQRIATTLRWAPAGTTASLDVDVAKLFAELKALL